MTLQTNTKHHFCLRKIATVLASLAIAITIFNFVHTDSAYAASVSCNPNATFIEEAVCLQDINWSVEHTMAFGRVYKLIDPRDGEEYSVGRLRDERVWLLDNLRLGGEEEIVLTSEDTNLEEGTSFTLPSSNTWDNSYEEPYIGTSNKYDTTSANDEWQVGNYYNYCAASAGTVCDESGEATQDAQYDICPVGWQLPSVGESSSDLNFLMSRLDNSSSSMISDLRLVLSGRYYNGASGYIDEDAYIWSSTLRDGQRVRYLTYNGSNVRLNESYRRDRGYSIRCVAKKSERPIMTCNQDAKNINEAVCLQDMNPLVKASMVAGREYRLFDSRDSEQYRVAKLQDGNVWLLDNLMIGKAEEIVLTSEDTNIEEGTTFTLPTTNTWENSYEAPYLDAVHKHEITSSSEEWQIGNYYNYCAASAGTVCDPQGENERDAEYDICPSNWRMPTGGINGEYGNLFAILDYDSLAYVNTLHLPLSGRHYDGSQGYIDRDGYFWSSTYRDGSRMRYINYDGVDVNPAGSYNRDRGYSMRCLANVGEFGSGEFEWVDGNEHTIAEGEGLILNITLNRDALLYIEVDGEIITNSSFELTGDDTTIKFKAPFLNSLSEGEHTVVVTYQEGVIIETSLTVKIGESANVPNTGANSTKRDAKDDYAIIITLSGAGIALLAASAIITAYFVTKAKRIHYKQF
ncbi:hypothetical protein IK146_02990 [Candidatus Saccharibacteria bacterium]|nr:hypothetical protein [Candidatus Saccharibacteria bacterium]